MKQVDHFIIIQIESKIADLGLKLFYTRGREICRNHGLGKLNTSTAKAP